MVWSHSYFPFHVLEVLLLNMEGAIKLKFFQTACLEVCYGMVSFFAKVKIFRFRPKKTIGCKEIEINVPAWTVITRVFPTGSPTITWGMRMRRAHLQSSSVSNVPLRAAVQNYPPTTPHSCSHIFCL